jgi:hypothetical protein
VTLQGEYIIDILIDVNHYNILNMLQRKLENLIGNNLDLFFLQSKIIHGCAVSQASFMVKGTWAPELNRPLVKASRRLALSQLPEKYKDGSISFFWIFTYPQTTLFFFQKSIFGNSLSVNLDKIRTSLARINYRTEYHDFLAVNPCRDDTYTFKEDEFYISHYKNEFAVESFVIGKTVKDVKKLRPLTKNLASRYYYLESRKQNSYYWESA